MAGNRAANDGVALADNDDLAPEAWTPCLALPLPARPEVGPILPVVDRTAVPPLPADPSDDDDAALVAALTTPDVITELAEVPATPSLREPESKESVFDFTSRWGSAPQRLKPGPSRPPRKLATKQGSPNGDRTIGVGSAGDSTGGSPNGSSGAPSGSANNGGGNGNGGGTAKSGNTSGSIVDGAVIDSAPSPTYPPKAIRDHREGTVTLLALVRGDGSVEAALIETSSGHGSLDSAARDALLTWKFKPRLVDGSARPFTARVPFRFFIPAE